MAVGFAEAVEVKDTVAHVPADFVRNALPLDREDVFGDPPKSDAPRYCMIDAQSVSLDADQIVKWLRVEYRDLLTANVPIPVFVVLIHPEMDEPTVESIARAGAIVSRTSADDYVNNYVKIGGSDEFALPAAVEVLGEDQLESDEELDQRYAVADEGDIDAMLADDDDKAADEGGGTVIT